MLDIGYTFISAYLKGEEAKTVTSAHLAAMTRVIRIQDLFSAIAGTDIGSHLEGLQLKTFDDADYHLWNYLDGCVQRLEWFKNTPADIIKISRAYMSRYDIYNIKAFLHGISDGGKALLIPAGTINRSGFWDQFEKTSDVASVMDLLNRCGLQEYAGILTDFNITGGKKLLRSIDHLLDEKYYSSLLRTARKIKDGELLAKILSVDIDMNNLKVALRAAFGGMSTETANYFIGGGYMISRTLVEELISVKPNEIPGKLEGTQYRAVVEEILKYYEKEKSSFVIDKVMEKNRFRMMRELLAPRVMSPLVVVWYLFIKEYELRNVRLLCKAVFDETPVDEVKEYLVLAS